MDPALSQGAPMACRASRPPAAFSGRPAAWAPMALHRPCPSFAKASQSHRLHLAAPRVACRAGSQLGPAAAAPGGEDRWWDRIRQDDYQGPDPVPQAPAELSWEDQGRLLLGEEGFKRYEDMRKEERQRGASGTGTAAARVAIGRGAGGRGSVVVDVSVQQGGMASGSVHVVLLVVVQRAGGGGRRVETGRRRGVREGDEACGLASSCRACCRFCLDPCQLACRSRALYSSLAGCLPYPTWPPLQAPCVRGWGRPVLCEKQGR